MTAVSAMVLVLLGTALVVAVGAVLVATGRLGEGIALPARTPRRSRREPAAVPAPTADETGDDAGPRT